MNTKELTAYIKSGKLADKLLDIYLDRDRLSYQTNRYLTAISRYEEIFGETEIQIISAPGRTEVCGNHTDHQHGHVLAASINDDAIAIVSANASGLIRIKSEGYDMITIQSDDTERKTSEEGTSVSLIRGILSCTRDKGYRTGGFDAYITSDVPGGSGLSSSAAYETVIGNILSHLYNGGKINAVTIAIIGQYAENVYFGKPCGLMDQMACSIGSLCHIDFADPDTPQIERLELDMDNTGYCLCITDTKGSHADLTPDYAAIPAEMKSVAAYFGKEVLREVSEEKVIAAIPALREKLGDRAVLRALHFYAENRRVIKESEALKTNNMNTFLANVKASGDSSYKFLQNVYTNHDIQRQNVSVALCLSEKVLGADGGVCRVHGGGFAGTIQAFVRKDKVAEYKNVLDSVFGEGSCVVLQIRKYGGIRVI